MAYARLFPDDCRADGADCRFSYTTGSPPILVSGNGTALVKISGDLVRLQDREERFVAPPLSVELRETGEDTFRDLIIGAGQDYDAGFRGQYSCKS